MDEQESGDLGSDFEFGPGTDLILSMLAFLLVVLGIVRLGQSSVVPAEPAPGGAESAPPKLVELHDESLAIFEQGSSRLTEPGAALLREKLAQLAESAQQTKANVLRIKGYASPIPKPLRLPGGDLDGNLDLSSERSTEIAHALHVLGMPYNCIAVESYGRSRSPFLLRYLEQHQLTMAEWDKRFSKGCSPKLTSAQCSQLEAEIEKLYSVERRVDLVVAQDADAPCTSEQLRASLESIGNR
jgi:OmpA family protein